MLTKSPKTKHKRRVAPGTAKRWARVKPPELPKLVTDGAGPAGQPLQTPFEAITTTITANTLTTITKRWLADEIARANAFARAEANVLRAVNDLLPKLKRTYGQPARDEADMCSQDVVALLAIADLLNRVGQTGDLAHFADRFAMLTQRLGDRAQGLEDAAIANQPLRPRTCTEITERVLPIMNAEDDPELDAIDNRRRRYVRALWAIAKIDDDNLLPQVGTYIGGLAVALEDLIEGVTDPLFVTKGPKSTRDSKRVWGPRLQAALGVEYLVSDGLKRWEIKDTVVRHHGNLSRLMRGARRDLGGSVLFWYDCFREGNVPVEALVDVFREARRELNEARLSSPEKRRRAKQAFEQAIKTASR